MLQQLTAEPASILTQKHHKGEVVANTNPKKGKHKWVKTIKTTIPLIPNYLIYWEQVNDAPLYLQNFSATKPGVRKGKKHFSFLKFYRKSLLRFDIHNILYATIYLKREVALKTIKETMSLFQ
jgi:hypothetical protein